LLNIELDKLSQRLGRQGRSLQVDQSARAWLCREHDIRFGARALARRIRTELEPAIAERLLVQPDLLRLSCTAKDGHLLIN